MPAPKKSLGQHFLHNTAIIERIVAALDVQANDTIVEIGPGPGALTNLLRDKPFASLTLIEKDGYYATEHKARQQEHVTVLEMDALQYPFAKILTPWKCISNLPYNVASPLMWDIVSTSPTLSRAVFMMQKEVADRIMAKPHSKVYGALSVWIQAFCKVEKIVDVKPGSFTPPPKVDSTVLRFIPKPEKEKPQKPEALAALLHVVFQKRRKQLGGILRTPYGEQVYTHLEALGISPTLRPEDVSVPLFLQLATVL